MSQHRPPPPEDPRKHVFPTWEEPTPLPRWAYLAPLGTAVYYFALGRLQGMPAAGIVCMECLCALLLLYVYLYRNLE